MDLTNAGSAAKLRALPAIGLLLELWPGAPETRHAAAEALRGELVRIRAGLLDGSLAEPPAAAEIVRLAARELAAQARPVLRRVINATGIILHTNLGRAPLAPEALQAVMDVAGGYCNLEMDLAAGERGSRLAGVEPLLCRLTGAEAALAVNNCAAAVLLALAALAGGRRGDRLPRRAGGDRRRLPHSGRDRAGRRAAGGGGHHQPHPHRRLPRRDHACHPRAAEGAPVQLPHHRLHRRSRRWPNSPAWRGRPGCCWCTIWAAAPWARSARLHEPTPRDSIAAGADVVAFSGDKLGGGPQAGLLVGPPRADRYVQAPPADARAAAGQDDPGGAGGDAAPARQRAAATARCRCCACSRQPADALRGARRAALQPARRHRADGTLQRLRRRRHACPPTRCPAAPPCWPCPASTRSPAACACTTRRWSAASPPASCGWTCWRWTMRTLPLIAAAVRAARGE